MAFSTRFHRDSRVVRNRRRPAVEGLEARTLTAVRVTQFPLASSYSQTAGIINGPDGNLWFAENASVYANGTSHFAGAIGVINPTTHALTEILTPTVGSSPANLAIGPDGDIWFTESGSASIGVINPATHAIAEYPIGAANSTPDGIVAGPDGNLWFTDPGNGSVGVINPGTHVVVEHPLPRATSKPGQIILGPDHDLWFTERGTGAIAQLNPTTGAVTEFPLTFGMFPQEGIVLGPDNNFWFSVSIPDGRYSENKLAELNSTSHVISEFPNVYATELGGVAVGPGGAIWFDARQYSNVITPVTINPTTHATYLQLSLLVNGPALPSNYAYATHGLVTGPDGNVWSTTANNAIDLVQLVPATEAILTGQVMFDPLGNGGNSGGYAVNRTVYADLKGTGVFDPGDPFAVTDKYGDFTMTGVPPGNVTVRVLTYPGDVGIGPNGGGQVVAATGGQITNIPTTFGITTSSAVLPLTFNPTPFGTHNPDVSTAEVNGLYQLILGRAPDPAGGAAAVTALKNGTSLALIASGLFHSKGYEAIVVADDFRAYLHVDVSADVIAAGVNALQSGWTEEQLAAYILDSADYNQIHPSDAGFVMAAWRDVKGREANPDEVTIITGLLARGTTRAEVIDSLLRSDEALNRSVYGLYTIFLARYDESNRDYAGLQFWVAALKAGVPLVEVAIDFAGSADFIHRADATVG